MAAGKPFLITGATGVVGQHLTRVLLERGHPVRAVVHRLDGRSAALAEAGAQIVVADLLKLPEMARATEDVGAAYFAYPIADGLLEATTIFAQAAADSGLGCIVNMSQKPARPDAASNASRQHWLAERILDRFPVPATHIRPTLFAEWLITFLGADGVLRLPFAKARHAPIAAEDQARVVAAILEDPARHDGQIYPLHGPVEMDHSEIAEALSRALGREISYEPISLEMFAAAMDGKAFAPHLVQHLSNLAVDYRNGVFSGTDDLVRELTGTPPVGIEEFAVRNKRYFDGDPWVFWATARRATADT